MRPLLLEMARLGDRAAAARAPRASCAACAIGSPTSGASREDALRVAARAARAAGRHDRQSRLADARRAARATSWPRRRCARRARRLRRDPGTHRPDHRRVPRRARGAAAPTTPSTRIAALIARLGERSRRRGGSPPARTRTAERSIPMSDFTLTTPTQEPDLETAMKVVYQWNYEPEVEELRRLYVKAAEAQWVAERDLDWDRPIDLAQVRDHAARRGACRSTQTSYWKSLPRGDALELTRRTAAFRPEQLPARRAGRAHGGGAARERGAAHRRQVLRRDADDGRGAPRRGVRPLHREARRDAADRAAAASASSTRRSRPATG